MAAFERCAIPASSACAVCAVDADTRRLFRATLPPLAVLQPTPPTGFVAPVPEPPNGFLFMEKVGVERAAKFLCAWHMPRRCSLVLVLCATRKIHVVPPV